MKTNIDDVVKFLNEQQEKALKDIKDEYKDDALGVMLYNQITGAFGTVIDIIGG